jgi:hypothetical protein
MKILDFGKSAVKVSSIQYMNRVGSHVTRIGFIDGTEDDFAVNSQKALQMWSDVEPTVLAVNGAVFALSNIAAIQFFPKGHQDSPFKKKEAVFRIWFDHGELFFLANPHSLPDSEADSRLTTTLAQLAIQYPLLDSDARLLRYLIDTWKALK